MEQRIRSGLRGKIFLAHLLVIAVGVITLFVATLGIAPTLFNRLMTTMCRNLDAAAQRSRSAAPAGTRSAGALAR